MYFQQTFLSAFLVLASASSAQAYRESFNERLMDAWRIRNYASAQRQANQTFHAMLRHNALVQVRKIYRDFKHPEKLKDTKDIKLGGDLSILPRQDALTAVNQILDCGLPKLQAWFELHVDKSTGKSKRQVPNRVVIRSVGPDDEKVDYVPHGGDLYMWGQHWCLWRSIDFVINVAQGENGDFVCVDSD